MEVENLNNSNVEENEDNEEEYLEEDLYLLELHKKLTTMKNERRKAENEASLLNNRLNLLKGEEDKVKYCLSNFLIYQKRPGKR